MVHFVANSIAKRSQAYNFEKNDDNEDALDSETANIRLPFNQDVYRPRGHPRRSKYEDFAKINRHRKHHRRHRQRIFDEDNGDDIYSNSKSQSKYEKFARLTI
jgi:hypothetical protein